MARIKIDYDKALQQAKQIDGMGDQCIEQARTVKNYLKQIPECWKGDSAGEMISKCNEWIKEQERIGNDLKKNANAVRTAAKKLKAADEKLKKTILA